MTPVASAQLTLDAFEQGKRRQQICANSTSNAAPLSGAQIATQLAGLTDGHRGAAMTCLWPQQSFEISISEAVQIVGIESAEHYRRGFVCRLSDNLPVNQNSADVSRLISGITGSQRYAALSCLLDKLPDRFSASDTKVLMGPLLPDLAPDWDGLLRNYSVSQHRSTLCMLREKLVEPISVKDASELLGLSRNQERHQILTCIKDKLPTSLTWDQVEELIGPSIYARGSMISTLAERTPDGRNREILKSFHQGFERNRDIGYVNRFLNDPDPAGSPPPQFAGMPNYPGWLGGQCIAWVQMAFSEISAGNIYLGFSGAARNIPDETRKAGFETETDPLKARVGALVVWDGGGFGHVGIITNVVRHSDTGKVSEISFSEANWGRVEANSARQRWGLEYQQAVFETVTDKYGFFARRTLRTDQLDRVGANSQRYSFSAYVYPKDKTEKDAP